MNRALTLLAVAALLVMLLETAPGGSLAPAAVLGTVMVVWLVAAYRWSLGRGRVAAVGYVAVGLALGYVVFNVAGPGVGSTLLLVVVVVQAVVLLPLWWAAAAAACVPFVHAGMPMADGFRQIVSTALACAFAFVLAALHLREQRARTELAVANAQLRAFSAQVEELATVQERSRVAREIHDGLGHHLTVVGMQVQAARAVLGSDPARADGLLAQAEDQSRQAMTAVREAVAALREPRPGPALPDRLRRLATDCTEAGLPTTVRVDGPERPLGADVEAALLRAAQEGLTNIRKHASAQSAVLRLGCAAEQVSLEVRDDGRGLRAHGDGFGLVGMRERAERLGGSLAVESAPGAGVAVRVELPG